MTHPIFARLDQQLAAAEAELRNLEHSHARSEALRTGHPKLYDEWTHRSALAEGIRSVFTGLEGVMAAVATEIDGYEAPAAGGWHEKLVDQMAVPIDGVRAALLDANLRAMLHELRRFRHVLHHNYAQHLDTKRVLENYRLLRKAFAAFKAAYRKLSAALQG